jgi:hypothetical protein
MTHSLNKEASQLLCDAVRCRVEDGDATAEDWTDSKGKALAADRFWNDGIEPMIAGDKEGPCLGIQLNILGEGQGDIFMLCLMRIVIIR